MSKKKPAEEPPLDYSVTRVKYIEVRLKRVYEGFTRATVQCTLWYVIDGELVQKQTMDEAVRRRDARRNGTAENDDDDDEEDDEEDDQEDEEEDEEEDEDAEYDVGKSAKRVRLMHTEKGRRRFDLHVWCEDLPLLDMYSKMMYMLLPGATKYPPSIGDMRLQRVVSTRRSVIRASALFSRLTRMLPWLFIRSKNLRIIGTEKRVPIVTLSDALTSIGRSKASVTETRLSGMLLADSFRCAAFYALLGVVRSTQVRKWSDAKCTAVLDKLVAGDVDKLVFSYGEPPLDLIFEAAANRHELRALSLVEDRDDCHEYGNLVSAPEKGEADEEVTSSPLRGLAFRAACQVWTHLRTAKRGSGGVADLEEVAPGMTKEQWLAGVGYLVSRRKASVYGGFVITTGVIGCMGLMQESRPSLKFSVFVGNVGDLPRQMSAVIGTRAVEESSGGDVLVLCPTMQACRAAWNRTGWNYADISMSEEALVHLIRRALIIVISEAHLCSLHAIGIVFRSLDFKSPMRQCHVILCGCDSPVVLDDAYGMPFPFAHIATARTSSVFRSEPALTQSVLESARGESVPFGTPGRAHVRLIETPVETQKSVADTAALVLTLCRSSQNRAPFIVFESRRMMAEFCAHEGTLAAFPPNMLFDGGWAQEADGGVRRIEKLWVSEVGSRENRHEKIVVNLLMTAPECIYYRMRDDHVRTVRNFAAQPISMKYCAVIAESRISALEDTNVIAVFSDRDAPLRSGDLAWLAHITRDTLLVVLAGKTNGTRIVSNTHFSPNVYTATEGLCAALNEHTKNKGKNKTTQIVPVVE